MHRLLFTLIALATSLAAMAKVSFKVGGPERSYNQIRVINNTSHSDYDCRVVILNEKEDGTLERGDVYGTYHLKGKQDIDTNSAYRVRRGTILGLEMPKEFDDSISINVEYRNHPFFDSIIIVISDSTSELETF